MFDISFAELMMAAVVTLLVVGPDKLPQVARTVGAFVGRLQRYVAQVKEEVNRDDRFEELQKLQQEIKQGADKVESTMMAGASEVKQMLVATSVKPKRKPAAKTLTAKTKPLQKKSVKKPATKKTKKDKVRT